MTRKETLISVGSTALIYLLLPDTMTKYQTILFWILAWLCCISVIWSIEILGAKYRRYKRRKAQKQNGREFCRIDLKRSPDSKTVQYVEVPMI